MFRFIGRALAAFLVFIFLAAAAVFLGPVQQVDLSVRFDETKIGMDLDAWLEEQESAIPDIIPRTQKHIVWAGAKGAKTQLSVVYLHGFSGTGIDIDPVPEKVAKTLGANVYYARLTGHGIDASSLGAATPESWIEDTAEALAIGRKLGEKVLVIGTSTGGTLATIAAADPVLSKDIVGVVLVSPNFRTKSTQSRIFDLGFAPVWVPFLTGPEYSRAPTSEDHATYWITTYPISALFNVTALARAAQTLDLTSVDIPLVVLYSPDDQVVDAQFTTATFLEDWLGPVRWEAFHMTEQDDPGSHMIIGDIRSPAQTASAIEVILDWSNGLDL